MLYYPLKTILCGIMIICFLANCGPKYDYNCGEPLNSTYQSSVSQLRRIEKALGTNREDLWVYHRIVEEPYSLTLSFDGYIVGVEKSPKEKVINKDDKENFFKEYLNNIDTHLLDNHGKYSQLGKELKKGAEIKNGKPSDEKRHFISHIFSYFPSDAKEDKWNNKISQNVNVIQFYNVYQSLIDSPEKYTGETISNSPFSDGLKALNNLHKEINTKIDKKSYTHVFFFCMGWHTDQQESFRNFNSLFGNILYQANKEEKEIFNPLFVGLTWPSSWNRRLIPPFYSLQQLFSYWNKSADADEIGTTVASYLLNRVILPLKTTHSDLKVVVVGHSFGVRLTSSALFLKKLLPTKSNNPIVKYENPYVDLYIGLEGAVSVNRFLPVSGNEGQPYKIESFPDTKFVYTWSEHDTANPVANFVTGAKHIGGTPGFNRLADRIAKQNDRGIKFDAPIHFTKACLKNDTTLSIDFKDMKFKNNTSKEKANMLMVNASEIIKDELYKKGGKAHSDIYNAEVAKMLYSLIQEYTMEK